jgi:multisubunit Na+/H+ antiporter MnhB subunit
MASDAPVFLAFCGLVAIASVVGLIVFRHRPDRVEAARLAGEPPQEIERQLALLRRMRFLLWLVLIGGVLGMVAAVLFR